MPTDMLPARPTTRTLDDKSRFAFGVNWRSFLDTLDQERIDRAVQSMVELIGGESAKANDFSLAGKRMLDLGSGSGLFSLAAHRLGGDVLSIDFDMDSVACTEHLRATFGASDPSWEIRQGSALDAAMLAEAGTFDLVYSWGVLHHTGDMWRAIELTAARVASGGLFVLSIYNDQGRASRRWLAIKQRYNRLPRWLRAPFVLAVAGAYEFKFAIARLKNGRNPLPFEDWNAKKRDRGMSVWHDWVDWVGGLPFEVASTDQVVDRLDKLGFASECIKPVGKGWGCNEFVFRRTPS